MATLYEDWRNVKRELGRMVNRMEVGVRAAESGEDMRQQAYAHGRRDGQAEARHDYCNGCGSAAGHGTPKTRASCRAEGTAPMEETHEDCNSR